MMMHLHITLVKLSNSCVERNRTLFRWIFDIQTAQTSTQLTTRYGHWTAIVERVYHTNGCTRGAVVSTLYCNVEVLGSTPGQGEIYVENSLSSTPSDDE